MERFNRSGDQSEAYIKLTQRHPMLSNTMLLYVVECDYQKKIDCFFHTRKKEKLSTQNSTSFAMVAKRVQHVLYINDEGEYWLGASLQHTNSNSNTSLQLLQDRDCISPTHTLRKIAPLTGN